MFQKLTKNTSLCRRPDEGNDGGGICGPLSSTAGSVTDLLSAQAPPTEPQPPKRQQDGG
ncbi:UNVERIFIED_CONTAM: hypothetical protein Sangu_1714800, partial [Sesamum angustifolium]